LFSGRGFVRGVWNFFAVTIEARAGGIEQTHERLDGARVFEQQEQIEGALVDAQQRGGQLPR
jgi:hypothetical protein